MKSEQVADLAAEHKHRKFMVINGKKRFIEVFKCSGDDMSIVLSSLPATPHAPLPAGLIAAPAALPPLTNALPAMSGAGVLTNGMTNGLGLTLPVSLGNSALGFAPIAAASTPSQAYNLMPNKPVFAQGTSKFDLKFFLDLRHVFHTFLKTIFDVNA